MDDIRLPENVVATTSEALCDVTEAQAVELADNLALIIDLVAVPDWRWRAIVSGVRKDECEKEEIFKEAKSFYKQLKKAKSVFHHQQLRNKYRKIYDCWYLRNSKNPEIAMTRAAFEAYLCCRDCDVKEAAKKAGVSESIALIYEKIFFDVSGFKDNFVRIVNSVIKKPIFNGVDHYDYESILKFFAILGGKDVLTSVICGWSRQDEAGESTADGLIFSIVTARALIAAATKGDLADNTKSLLAYAKMREGIVEATQNNQNEDGSSQMLSGLKNLLLNCSFDFSGMTKTPMLSDVTGNLEDKGAELRAAEQVAVLLDPKSVRDANNQSGFNIKDKTEPGQQSSYN